MVGLGVEGETDRVVVDVVVVHPDEAALRAGEAERIVVHLAAPHFGGIAPGRDRIAADVESRVAAPDRLAIGVEAVIGREREELYSLL